MVVAATVCHFMSCYFHLSADLNYNTVQSTNQYLLMPCLAHLSSGCISRVVAWSSALLWPLDNFLSSPYKFMLGRAINEAEQLGASHCRRGRCCSKSAQSQYSSSRFHVMSPRLLPDRYGVGWGSEGCLLWSAAAKCPSKSQLECFSSKNSLLSLVCKFLKLSP